jgi:hypothetical protein
MKNYQFSDPIFDKCINQRNNVSSVDAVTRKERIRMLIQQELKSAGANLQYAAFRDDLDDVDGNTTVMKLRTPFVQQMFPDSDPDLRFPVSDTQNIQHLYEQLIAHEMEVRVKYDYALLLRDDTMWFNDFDIQAVNYDTTAATRSSSHNFLRASSHIELFVPSCDPHVPFDCVQIQGRSLQIGSVPTELPTSEPFEFESPVPSDISSSVPSDKSSSVPSDIFSDAPSDIISDVPSSVSAPVIGSLAPAIDSPAPALTLPTPSPTVDSNGKYRKVTTSIDNVQITFTGIPIISGIDVLELQVQLESWFETYFNEDQSIVRRYLMLPPNGYRHLQQQSRVPGVRNMDTRYDVLVQDTTTMVGSNIITLKQTLKYDAASDLGDFNAETFVLLPFMDSMYKELLVEESLANIDSFRELSEISTPVIAKSVETESGGLSTGAIVGIVVGVILGLALLMVGIWKFVDKRSEGRAQANDNDTETNREWQSISNVPVGPPLNNAQPQGLSTSVTAQLISNPSAQSNEYMNVAARNDIRRVADPPAPSDDYMVTYKDQSRSVIDTTPMVQAFVRSNNNEDASMFPVVSAVPYQTVSPPPNLEP